MSLSSVSLAGTIWDAGGGATTNIDTATNWDGDVVNALDGTTTATFGTGGSTAVINTNASFSGITFNRDGNFAIANGAGSLTIGSGGINAAIPNTTSRTYTISESNLALGASQTWTTTNNGVGITTLVVSSAISGPGFGITKAGDGTLTLSSASNIYTGLTTVSEGRLIVTGRLGNNSSAFVDTGATLEYKNANNWSGNLTGQGTIEINANQPTFSGNNTAFAGTVNVLTGGRLNLSTGNAGSANAAWVITGNGILAMAGSGTYEFGSLSGTGNFGTGASATAILRVGALGTDTTYTGRISGGGTNHMSLEKVGDGTLTLDDTAIRNVYDRSTTISGGTLEVKYLADHGLASSIGTAVDLTNNGQSLVINGGTLKFSGTTGNGSTNRLFTIGTSGATIDGSSTDNTALTFTNTGSLATTAGATGRTLTLTGTTSAATQNSIASIIVDPTGGGTTAVTKTGGNTWVLAGVNTYTGTTTVSGGTLALTLAGSIDNTSSVTLAGGTFDVSAKGVGGYAVNNLSGTGNVVGLLTVDNELAIGASPGTIDFGSLTLAGTSIYDYELTGGGLTADLGNVSGSLTLNNAALDLTQLGTYTLGDKFTLFAYQSGNLTGNFNLLSDGAIFTDAGGDWLINYFDTSAGLNGGTGTSFITVTAVPEPSTLVLGGLAFLGFAGVGLRRRRQRV